jgi:hypothetical protein
MREEVPDQDRLPLQHRRQLPAVCVTDKVTYTSIRIICSGFLDERRGLVDSPSFGGFIFVVAAAGGRPSVVVLAGIIRPPALRRTSLRGLLMGWDLGVSDDWKQILGRACLSTHGSL